MPSTGASMGECYINRLPIELLAAIFEEHSVLELRAPFIDSQVCHRWHETTQLWPRVWSYITMRSTTEHNIPIDQFQTILERSGDSPLHINLEYPDFALERRISAMLLFQHLMITRIRTLLLKGGLPGDFRMMEGMPNLRILQLRKCHWGGTMKFLLGTGNFPLLDELVVHLCTGSLPRVALGSPVLLRTVSFCYVKNMEWVKILSECRETLVEVFICHCKLPPSAQIHLPNLKFLALSYMFNFRDDIVAPNLLTFHEHLEHLALLKLPFTFSSITEYACRVTSSFVGDEPFFAGHELPNLERFVLWSSWTGIREVLWELVSHTHAVPKLNTIELATGNGEDLSGTQWAELARLVVHTPLSSTFKQRTNSGASSTRLRFSLVRGSSIILI